MQTLPFYATQKKVFFYVCKVCYIFICSLNVPFRVKSDCGLKLSLMAVIRRDNAMKRTSKQNLVSWNCDVHKVANVASGFSVLCVSTIRFTHRKLSQKEIKRLINLEPKVVLVAQRGLLMWTLSKQQQDQRENTGLSLTEGWLDGWKLLGMVHSTISYFPFIPCLLFIRPSAINCTI